MLPPEALLALLRDFQDRYFSLLLVELSLCPLLSRPASSKVGSSHAVLLLLLPSKSIFEWLCAEARSLYL